MNPVTPRSELSAPADSSAATPASHPPERALSAGKTGTWDWQLTTRKVTWSPVQENLCGLPEGTFEGTYEAILSLIHPDDRETVQAAVDRSLDEGGSLHVLYRVIHPDGTVRWLESRGQVTRTDSGEVRGLAGICLDVTDRRALEEENQAREQRLQTLADNAPVLLARISRERRFLFANRAYQDITGLPLDQILGQTMAEVLGASVYGTLRPYVDRVLAGEAVSYEARLEYPTGPRWMHGSYVPERGPGGAVTGFLLSAIDVTASREAADANQRLALLVEHSYEAIISSDLDGTILSWNRGAERIFGYTAAEAVGQSVLFLYRPEDVPLLQERRASFPDSLRLEEIEPHDYDAVRRRKDGTECSVVYTLWPLQAEDGRRTGFASLIRDVTAQKEAEDANRRLALLVEHSHDAILGLTLDGVILSWNRGAEQLYGYTAADTVGRSVALLYTPEDALELPRWLHELRENSHPREFETVRVCQDGTRRHVSVIVSPVKDAQGQLTGLSSIARDITAQKEAEEAAQRLSLIVEHSHDAIISTALDGTILSWNRGAERLYGYTAAEAVGRSPAFFHPAEDLEAMRERLEALRLGVNLSEYEAVRVCKDGSRRLVSVTISPVRDSRGEVMSHSAISRDITAQKAAERERRRLADYVRLLLDSSGEGIFGLDRDGGFTFLNPAAARMLRAEPAQLLGRHAHSLVCHTRADGKPYPVEECPLYQAISAGRECRVDEELFWRLDGTPFPVQYSAAPLFEDGLVQGCVVTVADISERKAWEAERERRLQEANERADRDPLTGLLNHRAFHKRLEEETERCGRGGTFLAIAMLDLNHFKFFNDAYGHLVGDDALRCVADALRQSSRAYDVLARFGGDEFAVLMPGVERAEAVAAADRLASRLQGLTLRPPGSPVDVPLELTMGVALFPDDGQSRLEAVARADERLYQAKSGTGSHSAVEPLREHLARTVEGFAMLDSLITAVDTKDRYTRRHGDDVLQAALRLADAMGLDDAARHLLSQAALLQEVGRIGVPDRILRKPGPLEPAEFAAVQQHPALSALLISAAPALEAIVEAVRHHHERWDGGGYPAGLAGEDIPLLARLLAVADAFSAMTTDRPYRGSLTDEQAREILAAEAGRQWDPACVAAFLSATRS